MKETARLRKRFHATAKYYKIMKAVGVVVWCEA